jgi:methylenetetrahydrofolate reductase (NADPH)
MTYYVINKQGDLRTNTHSDGPNAVTWGVFPGKEIVQPTVVEALSFMAWKVSHVWLGTIIPNIVLQDEAYELGVKWANVYEAETPSRKLMMGIFESSYLVNVVHNDFKDPQAIFEPFFKAGAEYAAQHTNGSAAPQEIPN